MKRFATRLLKATRMCRLDMHEPDEQNISAKIAGMHLDNAMGDDPYSNCQEYTIGLINEDEESIQFFNLATLIALARIGAELVLENDEVAKEKAKTIGR